ncbi:ParB/RepB/Spo0J family partition protein [Nocardia aurantiaca]|uniref:ParB/RepB/Spo0J family partition protein n=1 Tax=Nocardia aurantiaca TaxID=2675850 RepID=UPI0018AA1E60|nr:ParB N-terminal domain-containing protein [Nocardia aurantiaca]
MLGPKNAWWIHLRGGIWQWIAARAVRPGESSIRVHLNANLALLEPDPSDIVRIPLDRLCIDNSIRQSGENSRHVTALSEVAAALPPIVVHRARMTVIDGAHRVRAAMFSGAQWIDAVYFDGDDGQALLLAIRLNSAHGLPLSAADRKAAAEQALSFYPDWSNHQLAQVIGLSERTIAAIRKRATANPARRLPRHPSPAVQPLERQCRPERIRDDRRQAAAPWVESAATDLPYLARAVRSLRSDPALARTESGKQLLRLLDTIPADPDAWADMAANLPPYCAEIVAELAAQQAENWAALARSANRQAATAKSTAA